MMRVIMKEIVLMDRKMLIWRSFSFLPACLNGYLVLFGLYSAYTDVIRVSSESTLYPLQPFEFFKAFISVLSTGEFTIRQETAAGWRIFGTYDPWLPYLFLMSMILFMGSIVLTIWIARSKKVPETVTS